MSVQKKQNRYYSGKKKRHTQKAQLVTDQKSGKILASAFCEGKKHDFALFLESKTPLSSAKVVLADSGYQGITKLHSKSQTPKKKSKHNPLTKEEKASNREISEVRIHCEHTINRLKVFKILSERYRNRRRRFGLRFNLIAAICNLECQK